MKFNFQTILYVIFGFFIVFGVAVFAGYIDIGSSSKTVQPTGNVVIWGVLKNDFFKKYLIENAIG
ncbi:MAG: hypothetical protein RL641_674, partial [Candidatus Parcubacteria bacterium]